MPIKLETYRAPIPPLRRHGLLLTTFLLSLIALSGYLHHSTLSPYSLFSPSSRESHFCPSPINPRRNLTLSAATGATCTYPDAADGFVVSICHDPSVCNAFSLTVRRKDVSACLAGPGKMLSEDADLHGRIVNEMGPDDFRVTVEGAELFATTKAVIEECSYRFDVALQNAGAAMVQVTLFHSNFGAFDELSTNWVQPTFLPLLTTPFLLPACSPQCTTTLSPPFPLLAQLPTYHETILLPSHSHLPSCPPSTRHTLPGSYIPRPLWGLYSNIWPLIVGEHRLMPHAAGKYGFQPEGCVWRHQGMRFADHVGCGFERRRRVEVLGDSHARVAFDAMHNRLVGNVTYQNFSEKVGNKNFTLDKTHFDFSWDAFADILNDETVFTCEHVSSLSALVVSIGSHAAANGHTMARFTETLAFVQRLSLCPQPLPPMILLLPPPPPPRTDNALRNYDDRRTHPRMRRIVEILKDAALGQTEVWKVVDQTELLQAFEEYPMMTDKAHYLLTDGIEAVLDEMIGKMEICGQDERFEMM